MIQEFVTVIKACQNAGGAGKKKAIENALSDLGKDTRRLIMEAMSPYRVFGVRKFDMPTKYAAQDAQDLTSVFDTLDKLASRDLTGNAAKLAVTSMLSNFTEETASYLALIIGKDLKAGFSADTFNKIYPGGVASFDVMLADKYKTDEEVRENVTWPALVEAKYDGERTIAFVTEKGVVYRSRSGKEASHCDGLFDADLAKIHEIIGDFVADGERYASDFTETMNAKKSGNSEAKDNLRFFVFNIMRMTEEEWAIASEMTLNKHKPAAISKALTYPLMKMGEMRDYTAEVISAADCEKVSLSKGIIANTADEAQEYYRSMLKEGFEGLIIKNLDSVYAWKRNKDWIKWKPFFDFDGQIIGFYAGREGTRLENTLGGIIVEGIEMGKPVEVSVGSGFEDSERDEIWKNQDKYLGRIVELKYQEMTLAANSEKYSLRFPTFERFRDDK